MNDILTARELATRWSMSLGTLANWRREKHGPAFIKKGWTVLYPIESVKKFEGEHPELKGKRFGRRISPTR